MWGMGTVRANCPGCGVVALPAKDVEVHVCDNQKDLSFYRFACPTCRQTVQHHACGVALYRLLSVNTTIIRWKIPAEALELHDGPPLTADDLIDLHEQLAGL